MNGLKINKIEYILSLRDMQFVMEGTLYNTIWYTMTMTYYGVVTQLTLYSKHHSSLNYRIYALILSSFITVAPNLATLNSTLFFVWHTIR